MSVFVRARQLEDLESCVDVLARVHAAGGYPTNWPVDPARWLTPSGLVEAWVAGTGEVPVAGHMILTKAHAGLPGRETAEVGRVFVDPEVRRQGVARVLMRHVQVWAVDNGVDLHLWVTDQMSAAQALYKECGFSLAETGIADWTGPDGEPIVVHRYDWIARLSLLDSPNMIASRALRLPCLL